MRLSFILLSIPVLFMAVSCTPGEMTKDQLITFIAGDDHGLHKTGASNGYSIDVQYTPVELVFANQLLLETNFIAKRDSLKKAYSQFLYFKLAFSKNGKSLEEAFVSNPEKYKKLSSYLSAGINQEIQLSTSQESVTAYETLYSPMYGLSQTTPLLVVFKLEKPIQGDLGLIFHDSFIGIGRTEFKFLEKDFDQIPDLVK